MVKRLLGVAALIGAGVLVATRASARDARSASGTTDGPVSIERVRITNPVPGGYDSWRLRSDAAAAARLVLAELERVGARVSSSGGLRALNAPVSTGRVPASLHHLGLALDLWVGAGMSDPSTDPYIITRDTPRLWRVWARCVAPHGAVRTLDAVRNGRASVTVTARVVDLTALMERHGLRRIPARAETWDRIAHTREAYSGAEWWHFEMRPPVGRRFGDELRRIYHTHEITGTAAASFADHVWDGGRFVAPKGVA